MAKTKNTKATKATKNGKTHETDGTGLIPESLQASAPEGFDEVFGERVVGWWALTPGNVIRGILRDMFETKSKFKRDDGSNKKRVYKIEVTDPTGCLVMESGEDAGDDPVPVEKGDLVGVDEKGFLKALARVMVGQEIWIQYLGKLPPDSENPQGVHKFKGPLAKAGTKVNPVTGEVTS